MRKIIDDVKLDYADVLIMPKSSPHASRKSVKIERQFQFFHSPIVASFVPIIASNMYTTGTFAMAEELQKYNMLCALHKFYTNDEIRNWSCGRINWLYSLGIKQDEVDKLQNFINDTGKGAYPSLICVDIANGYTDDFIKRLQEIRKLVPKAVIMAGNVCTPEKVVELIKHGGVDIVKVGIGPGSACTTRLVAGVGYPQLSAVMECADAAHGLKSDDRRLGLICADGGITCPGDVCKAFGAGADFVMIGGMFAGTEECDGEWTYETDFYGYEPQKIIGWHEVEVSEKEYRKIYGKIDKSNPNRTYTIREPIFAEIKSPKKSLKFYGMSSYEAQQKHGGKIEDYRASEGRVIEVPYKGPVSKTIKEIEGGIRSCCAYIGATRIADMAKCTTFVKVNRVHNETRWSI